MGTRDMAAGRGGQITSSVSRQRHPAVLEPLEPRLLLSATYYDLSIQEPEIQVGVVGLAGNGQAEQGIAFIPGQGWATSSGSALEDCAITFYDADWSETSQIVYEDGNNFTISGSETEYNVKHIGDIAYGGGYIYAPLQLDELDAAGEGDGIVDMEYVARFTAGGALDTTWGWSIDLTGISIGGVGFYGGEIYAVEYVESATQDEWSTARVLRTSPDVVTSVNISHINVPYANGIAVHETGGTPFVHVAFGGSALNTDAPVGVKPWEVIKGTGAIAVIPLPELVASTSGDPLAIGRSDYHTYLSRPHAEGLTFDAGNALWVSRGTTVAQLIGGSVHRPVLSDPQLSRLSGSTSDTYEFTVRYDDPDDDPPSMIGVYLSTASSYSRLIRIMRRYSGGGA